MLGHQLMKISQVLPTTQTKYDGTFYFCSFHSRLLFGRFLDSISMVHLVNMGHTNLGGNGILWVLATIETSSDAIKKQFFSSN